MIRIILQACPTEKVLLNTSQGSSRRGSHSRLVLCDPCRCCTWTCGCKRGPHQHCIHVVPFLELNLLPVRAGLSGDELLEIADSIIWATLDAHYISISTGSRLRQVESFDLCVLSDRLQ